jgi:YD repeat-containing protein
MRLINTAKTWFAALAVTVVAAVPLYASIPREYRASRQDALAQEQRVAAAAVQPWFQSLLVRTNTVYADGSAEAFSYDAVGNLLSAGNDAATNAFAYDAMNRLTSAVTRVESDFGSSVGFRVSYAYDLGGLATNVTYPGGKSVRYVYDADGRVTNVTDWAGRSFTFARDAAGRMTALAYPNGVSYAYTYDANHKVSSWVYSSGGSPLAGRTITRDAMGLKTREDVTGGPTPVPATNRPAIESMLEKTVCRRVKAFHPLQTSAVRCALTALRFRSFVVKPGQPPLVLQPVRDQPRCCS